MAEDSTDNAINVLGNDTDPDTGDHPDHHRGHPARQRHRGHHRRRHRSDLHPDANYTGADTFTYTVSDGASAPTPPPCRSPSPRVNDAPIAVDDAGTVAEDSADIRSIRPCSPTTSTDDGADLHDHRVTQPTNGTLTLTGTPGDYTYTPNANFTGTDTFTYTVTDGTLAPTPATVSVTVTAVNDAPTAAGLRRHRGRGLHQHSGRSDHAHRRHRR